MTAQLPHELTADGFMIRDDRGVRLATVFLDFKRDTHAIAAEMVKRWNAHNALVDALDEILAAWDTLPTGNYPPQRIEVWLKDDMKPAVSAIRDLLVSAPRLDPPGCVSA